MCILNGCHSVDTAGIPENIRLGYEMQAAVLRDQDLNKIKEVLKNGFDINAPIGCGTYCAIDGAISVGNPEMLELLLKEGAKPPERSLVKAAFSVNEETAHSLVSSLLKAGVSPNAKDYYSDKRERFSFALSNAAWRGHEKVVSLLLKQPGIDADLINIDGRTALMTAVYRGEDEIVKMLVDYGADTSIVSPNGSFKGLTAQGILLQRIEEEKALVPLLDPS